MRALLKAGDCDGDLSITWVQMHGAHRRVRSRSSTRVYYVIEGRGRSEVDGSETIDADPGDLVSIPAGVAYQMSGPMTYLVISQPGFRDGDDHYPGTR
jgi:mannose-6-phosphate isomerase-like protein (cupin superfamily)